MTLSMKMMVALASLGMVLVVAVAVLVTLLVSGTGTTENQAEELSAGQRAWEEMDCENALADSEDAENGNYRDLYLCVASQTGSAMGTGMGGTEDLGFEEAITPQDALDGWPMDCVLDLPDVGGAGTAEAADLIGACLYENGL